MASSKKSLNRIYIFDCGDVSQRGWFHEYRKSFAKSGNVPTYAGTS
uniref:Uncharacterized protein n=1 Tax=Anguilla anguilla TaxID=7936 RepID=A0A0E9XC18_ANGAN